MDFSKSFLHVIISASRFGWILVKRKPTGAQLASQLGPKIDPKPSQEGCHIQTNLHHVLSALFDRLWKPLGSMLEGFDVQVEGQVDEKIYHMASSCQDGRNSKNAKNQKF